MLRPVLGERIESALDSRIKARLNSFKYTCIRSRHGSSILKRNRLADSSFGQCAANNRSCPAASDSSGEAARRGIGW